MSGLTTVLVWDLNEAHIVTQDYCSEIQDHIQ